MEQETFCDEAGVAFDAAKDGGQQTDRERRALRRAKGLTEKQLCFVEEYVIDFNATQAAIRAGYSAETAYSIGSENLRKPEIMAELAQRRIERSERLEITADRVLQELAKLAYYDPRNFVHGDGSPKAIHELDDVTAMALAGVEISQIFEGSGATRRTVGMTYKIKMADKGRNLERVGRTLGIFNDKDDAGTGNELTVLTVDV